MEKLTLFMSLRSPFARRIRLLLEELQVDYEAEVLDVFNPPASFLAINPLGRVPVLRLSTGEAIVDSTEIFQFLKQRHSSHALFSNQGASEARLRNITGLALGIMEYAVAAFLEAQRPQALRSAAAGEDFVGSIDRALKSLCFGIRGKYLLGSGISAWDLDLGSALGYCDLRLGTALVDRYPELRKYLERLEERPSFKKTAPPR